MKVRVPADVKAFVDEHDLTAKPSGASTRRNLACIGAFVAIAVAAARVDHPITWVGAWLVQATLLSGSYSAMHEATHGNMYRSRSANRAWGVFWASTILISHSSYRAFHLNHHANTRVELGKPQVLFNTRPGMLAGFPVIGPLFVVTFVVYSVLAALGKYPYFVRNAVQGARMRQDALVHLALLAIVSWCLVTAQPVPLLSAWLIPVALYYAVVYPTVTLPEHYGMPESDDPFETTRTMVGWRMFQYFYWNNNLHAAHHLYPAVPWDKVPVLDEYVRDRNTCVVRYTEFVGALIDDVALRRIPPPGPCGEPVPRLAPLLAD
ncbi:MAG TPA: fatty acid desaturase [Acidimicrobiales bacterium]|nr:fatty acid desaturase [Acidimicrobiales bacterium]